MKKLSCLLTATCAAAAIMAFAPQAGAWEAGDILLRGRAIMVMPDADSKLSLGGATIPGHADVSTDVMPEVDLSYFFTENISAEVIAATSNHSVSALNTPLGSHSLGHVWVLPPTITAQYHFFSHEAFSPYIGFGVNYTFFYGASGGDFAQVAYDNGPGYAIQAGFDYKIDDHWVFNADAKRLQLNTTAKVNGSNFGLVQQIKGDVDLNPWVIGVGIGYRF